MNSVSAATSALNKQKSLNALSSVTNTQNISPKKAGSPKQSPKQESDSSFDSDDDTKNRKKRKSHSVEEFRNKGEVKKLVQQSLDYYENGKGIEDRKKRYKKTEQGLLYLGEGLAVPPLGWYGLLTMGPRQFITELISMFWSTEDLAKLALNVDKVTTKLESSPITTIEGPLLRLLISVYGDYLTDQEDIPNVTRTSYLYSVTDILPKKIRNSRQKCLKNERKEKLKQQKENKKREAKKRLHF